MLERFKTVLVAVVLTYWAQLHKILTVSLSTDIVRKPDQLFGNVTSLYERLVTCGDRPLAADKAVYPSETLSCYDMRISGLRLQYWHMDGLCSDGLKSMPTRNDLGALCRSMMHAHQKNFTLWASIVGNASCAHSIAPRVQLVRMNSSYLWEHYHAGHGYVISLHCMADTPWT